MMDSVDEARIDRIRARLEKEFEKPVPEEEIRKYLPGVPVRSSGVIQLTKLNGKPFMLNSELIETFEATPDTVISLVTGRKYIVKESVEEVRDKYISFKREILRDQSV